MSKCKYISNLFKSCKVYNDTNNDTNNNDNSKRTTNNGITTTRVYDFNELSIIKKQNAQIYAYKNIQPHFEYINQILNTKFIKTTTMLLQSYEYSINAPLTDEEYNNLYYSIIYINDNYEYINTNISENEVLFDLYVKIAEYAKTSIYLKKINAMHKIISNYENIKKHICEHITIVKKFLFLNKIV